MRFFFQSLKVDHVFWQGATCDQLRTFWKRKIVTYKCLAIENRKLQIFCIELLMQCRVPCITTRSWTPSKAQKHELGTTHAISIRRVCVGATVSRKLHLGIVFVSGIYQFPFGQKHTIRSYTPEHTQSAFLICVQRRCPNLFIYESMHLCVYASMHLCIYLSMYLSTHTMNQGRAKRGNDSRIYVCIYILKQS